MSITLNNSDFQCLQDQLVDLKTKNYDLADKNRRSQADFEAAKAKICSLQLKLEEQERDFQITSSTLRREIEAASNNCNNDTNSVESRDQDEEHKAKYKKLLHKAKELQLRYEKSVEIIQQMDSQLQAANGKFQQLEKQNATLKEELASKQEKLDEFEKDFQSKLEFAIEEFKITAHNQCQEFSETLSAITSERDELQKQIEQLSSEVREFNVKIESQNEERKINDRKGLQIVKELKRQLALEKSRSETLQKRLESLLSEPAVVQNTDLEGRDRLSANSSTNGNSGSNGNDSRTNTQDGNSVSSWSMVQGKIKSTNQGLNETLSICSIDSEGRGNVQQPCDSKSECSLPQPSDLSASVSKNDLSISASLRSPTRITSVSPRPGPNESGMRRDSSSTFNFECGGQSSNGMLMEEQAALMERVTRLQHDKWTLEEKLSYMEQANAALTEDLANKSDIIRNYFKDQASKSTGFATGNCDTTSGYGINCNNNNLRRISFPNQLLSDKPSLKKVVDFLKERSQVSSAESESISREATKKMQIMLEETLVKCLKLQENLDFVTSELNRLKK